MRLGVPEGREEFPALTLPAFLQLHLTLQRLMHLMDSWDVTRQPGSSLLGSGPAGAPGRDERVNQVRAADCCCSFPNPPPFGSRMVANVSVSSAGAPFLYTGVGFAA